MILAPDFSKNKEGNDGGAKLRSFRLRLQSSRGKGDFPRRAKGESTGVSFAPEFEKSGAEILSVSTDTVSTDTVYVHKAWHDQSSAIRKIKYPMVADPAANYP